MKKSLFSLAILSLLFSACSKNEDELQTVESNGQLTLTYDAVLNNQDFALNKDFTVGSRNWNFSGLRYWVSNVSLINAKGEEVKIPNSYYLLEETNAVTVQDGSYTYPAKKREDVVINDLPAGDYKTLKFSVGVEQKYNDNLSLQAGELSQLNGMTNISWMWHTSYIFSTLTGKITESATSKNFKVETGLNANYKSVSLELPTAVRVGSSKAAKVLISADVAKVTDGIDVMTTSTVGAQQATAMQGVATNYQTKVFTVKSVN